MVTRSPASEDGRAGGARDRPPPFLVGDHAALDFLNSAARPRGELVEWIADGADLAAWLAAAGLLPGGRAAAARALPEGALDAAAEQARGLRAWWRDFVCARLGHALAVEAADDLGPLNAVLGRGSLVRRIQARGPDGASAGGVTPPLAWHTAYRAEGPDALLLPVAEAIGDLLVTEDFARVRPCEGTGCTLVFLDRTKGRTRRWCSMALCGNRAKAAAHRTRAKHNPV